MEYARPMAGTDTASLSRAWELIAYFFGEGATPPAGVPPELIDRVVTLHRLYGALADPRLAVRSPEAFVTPEIWERWRQFHAGALAQAVRRAEPTRRVFEALAPGRVIVLKGAAYAELLYPSPGARSMGDFDVLVPSEQLPESLAKLEDLGFSRHYEGDPTLDSPDYRARQLGSAELELDLHQAFTQPERLDIDYREVLARAVHWPEQAPNAWLLCPEDALVYHAINAGCGEFTPEWSPAIDLLDARQMVAPRSAFWGRAGGSALNLEVAIERAGRWGAERMLYATLKLSALLFPSVSTSAELAQRALQPTTQAILDRVILARCSPPRLAAPRRPEVLLRKALLLRAMAGLRLLRLRIPQVLAARAHNRRFSRHSS
jgi:hypothetical protein